MSKEFIEPVAYYDNSKKDYWIDMPNGWLSVHEKNMQRHLIFLGLFPGKTDGGHLTCPESVILRIQREKRVDYAGSLAGWNKGLYPIHGKQVLVTESPKLLTPKEGDWDLVRACIESLFSLDPRQAIIWNANLKLFLESLTTQCFRPRPAQFLIGPPNCGKSFLQNRTTEIIGGRAANPWLYISGKTQFNRDLFGAEHLKVEDPNVSSNSDRNDFSNMIKQLTVNEDQSCHGKFREAVTLNPRWFITISANNELHNLSVVPSLDESMMDKMNLFLCAAEAIPPEGYKDMPHADFLEKFRTQLPAYVWHLTNEFEIPKELESRRTGVAPYHHPELLNEIADQLPEIKLLDVIDANGLAKEVPWTGSANALVCKLAVSDFDRLDPVTRQFVDRPRSIPFLLSKLKTLRPNRVQKMKRTKSSRGDWIILPPNKGAEDKVVAELPKVTVSDAA
jgi:hypothetical protein